MDSITGFEIQRCILKGEDQQCMKRKGTDRVRTERILNWQRFCVFIIHHGDERLDCVCNEGRVPEKWRKERNGEDQASDF